jgi:hypothetical protein
VLGVPTITIGTLLDVNEDVDIDFDAADEEVTINNSAEYGADGAQVTIENTDADVTAAMYLLRLRYTDDGQANADFAVFEDNNGDDMITFTDGGAITAQGTITGGTITDGTATMTSGALASVTTISMGSSLTLSDSATIDQDAANTIDFTDNSDKITFNYGGTDLDIVWSDGVLNLRNNEDGINAIVEIEGKDAGERGELRVLSDGDDKYVAAYHDDTNSFIASSSGNLILSADGDVDDYIQVDTTTNLPSLSPDATGNATLGTTGSEWGIIYLGDDDTIQFGADQDTTLGYDETTDDRLELTTTLNAATGDEEAFAILYTTNKATSGNDTGLYINMTDTASPGTSYLIDAAVNGTSVFSVRSDGAIITAASVDPGVILDESTIGDTDFWFGVNADQVGDDDDYFEIGTGTTIGTNTKWQMDNAGNVVAQGGSTATSFTMEGGTYDTTITPGTPTASVSYQWPLADGTSGQVLATNASAVLSWTTVTATPAGSNYHIQWNNGTALDSEADFTYNDDNNTLNITRSGSNPIIQVGDGTYAWQFTPDVGIEGVLEVDSDIYGEDDLFLDSDSAVIWLGEDADITITHDPDDGIFLKSVATTAGQPVIMTLQTGETDIQTSDVLGGIYFQAPDEGTGTDSRLVAGGIEVVSEGDFSATSNASQMDFKLGVSEAATQKATLQSDGDFLMILLGTIQGR